MERLGELEAYLRDLAPPAYPFDARDDQMASRGEVLFEETCANCHGPEGARTGTVIPQTEVGTDRHRLAMWTAESVERYNAYAEDYPWDFDAFVKTDGYVAKPLTGIWLRAPYLHNGSVPTIEDLLRPAEERPEVFHRGYDVYDPERLGFIHEGEAADRYGFRYDTRDPGNGNTGHEYGTELPAEDRDALVEYLKTL